LPCFWSEAPLVAAAAFLALRSKKSAIVRNRIKRDGLVCLARCSTMAGEKELLGEAELLWAGDRGPSESH
jgi:hypothetical protein